LAEDQQELLEKARSSFAAAKWLLEGPIQTSQLPECTMPCSTLRRPFSKERGLAFSKHSAVIAAFGRHFARTGKVPAEFHRFLLAAQDLRHSGDYGPPHAVTPDQTREQIAHAEAFLSLAERLIGPLPPSSQGDG
jgi:hypothetical protein